MQHVFIIGSKGIPSNYGGFETFVDQLVTRKISKDITYHVACLGYENSEFYYEGARCFNVKVPSLGAATAVIYDLLALNQCLKYIKQNKFLSPVIYILACRIGPFLWLYKKRFKKYGVNLYVNPDGHEWKRSKWNIWIKRYWKLSERLMVKQAALLICDSRNIEDYILKDYQRYNPQTMFIPYGADLISSDVGEEELNAWFDKFKIQPNNYYLVVGRFVPENNIQLIIEEFMATETTKDLVLITNVEENKFYNELLTQTNFKKDERVKFVGTVYQQPLLKRIRELAYAYLHGHEVGGTNPSLLEALATTPINLLLDVCFNQEVGQDGARYFTKETGNLAHEISIIEKMSPSEIQNLANNAKRRIETEYTWNQIIPTYEKLFLRKKLL